MNPRRRRATAEIPNAELLVLEEADHYAAHITHDEILLNTVLGTHPNIASRGSDRGERHFRAQWNRAAARIAKFKCGALGCRAIGNTK